MPKKGRIGGYWIFTALNLSACLVFTYFGMNYFSSLAFFDRHLPIDLRLNSSMRGVDFLEEPERIQFEFAPSDRTRSLYIAFNYTGMEEPYSALRLSAIENLPSAWIRFADGWPVETILLNDTAGRRSRSVEIELVDDRVRLSQNAEALLNEPFELKRSSIDFIAYPSYGIQNLMPQLAQIRRLTVTCRRRNGEVATYSMISARYRHALVVVMMIAVALLYMTLDRYLTHRMVRGKNTLGWISKGLRTYPCWPIVFLILNVLPELCMRS